MAEQTIPVRRSALAGIREPGDFGAAPFNGPGILLSERTPVSVVQIETNSESAGDMIAATQQVIGTAPSARANRSTGAGRPRILGTGTGRWLVAEPAGRDLAATLRAALPDSAAVTDLSHARTVLRLSGRDARSLLAKGTSIDLHQAVFGPDTSRLTGLFHCAVLIDCRGSEPVYDIYVHRSYAVHLWEMLVDGALEYGCRVS